MESVLHTDAHNLIDGTVADSHRRELVLIDSEEFLTDTGKDKMCVEF